MKRKCSELKRLSRASILGQLPLIICSYVIVSAIISIAENIFTSPISNMYEKAILEGFPYSMPNFIDWPIICYAGLAAMFIVMLVSSIFTAGIMRINLDAARGNQVKIGNVFSQFKSRPDRFIILTLILLLCTCLPYAPSIVLLIICSLMEFEGSTLTVLTLTSMALLVIGMIISIYLSIKFKLAMYILVDTTSLSPFLALRDSYSLMSGNVFRYIYIILSFIPMALLVLFTFGLGSLWVQPYIDCTLANLYLDISGELNRKEEEAKRLEEEMGPAFDTYV
ncbi:MAG: DUF975 family protein [Lachnospiraceae bacterium]|nr:DUF975 family protein [Lachnospiraceae bacterium]